MNTTNSITDNLTLESIFDNFENYIMTETGGPPNHQNLQKIRFASINCSGLAGKTHIIENMLTDLNLDFIFLAETWCRPGTTKNLSRDITFVQESAVRSNGRAHYGQAIWINTRKHSPNSFSLLHSDENLHTIIFSIADTRFVCMYVPPGRPDSFFNDTISALEEHIICPEPCILVGDLNARHVRFGDHQGNHYGRELIPIMSRLGLERLDPSSGKWTFLTVTDRSIIDHVLVNDAALSAGVSFYIDEDYFVGTTDHCLLVGSVECTFDQNLSDVTQERPWNRWRLSEPDVVDAFKEELNTTMDRLLMAMSLPQGDSTAQAHADALYDLFDEWLTSALRHHIGRSPGHGRRPAEFLNHELIMKENMLRAARIMAFNPDAPIDQRLELAADYLECKSRLDDEIKNRREELFQDFAVRLKSMDVPAQLRIIHSLKKSRSQSFANGLKADEQSMNAYGEHFRAQYRNTQPVVFGPNLPDPAPSLNTADSPFSWQSISETAKEMPEGKAAGDSGLPTEALSTAHDLVAFPLHVLFDFCWTHSVIPTKWTNARIHPILKKGSASDIRNYRPISLTEVVRRLFERIILPVVTSFIEPLSVEQGGFRAHRGTLDQVATLQEWICQAKDKRLPRYMAFLDIKAAYDQVDREILWKKCRKKGLPEQVISLLKCLFDHNRSFIAVAGAQSPQFPMRSGLLQGSPISPVLYSLFVDDLVEELNDCVGTDNLRLGGRLFRCLLYADDIVLMSTSWKDLCRLLNIAERHSLLNRYRFGVSKCEAVLSSTPPGATPLSLYDEPLRCSPFFTYLGVPFAADGIQWKLHFSTLGAKAQRVAGFFNSLGCNGQGFDSATCLRLYQCFVRPILEYGLALCPPTMVKTVDIFYGRCMRLMTSMGTSTSALTIGMLSEIHPAKIRQSTLQMKFAEKTRRKPIVFAVNYALTAFNGKPTRNSCFKSWTQNDFISQRDRERFRARLERREAIIKTAHELQDNMLVGLLGTKSSCYIFRNKTRNQRAVLKRLFGQLNRVEQRLVLNWVTNRSAGWWKTCRRCGDIGATKSHLELCYWGEGRRGFRGEGPSKIEEELAEVPTTRNLSGCVAAIRELVGDRPADGRGAEPP